MELKDILELLKLENQRDSIELGTPSKTGVLKVYFNASEPEKAKEKIKQAKELLKFAKEGFYD